MRYAARLIASFALVLVLFLAGILWAQSWLRRQHAHIQAEAMAAKRRQFAAAANLTADRVDRGSNAHLDAIGRVIGANVQRDSTPTPITKDGLLRITETIPGTNGEIVFIEFPLPQVARLGLLHGRTWIVLLVGSLTLLLLLVGVALLIYRRYSGGDTRTPWSLIRTEMSGLEQLARTSAAQGSALAQERDTRQRIERDLALHQQLQNQALQEKIRLGRDLHDGLIQSLYAVGLTIEALRPLIKRDPVKAEQRLETCLGALNQTIRQVREYITGLSEDKLRHMSFTDAVQLFFNELRAEHRAELELTADEEAAAALTAEQTTEALQIIHEAISNALRHGRATRVTVRLHHTDTAVGLLISDNGSGFELTTHRAHGHGLANMRARAEGVGATLRIDSALGSGTRIVLTFIVQRQL